MRISWKIPSIFLFAVIVSLSASTSLGNNQIYELGVSFGRTLAQADDDLDLKELDYEIQQFGEQLGNSPMVDKLLSDDFVEGATYGYYERQILDR